MGFRLHVFGKLPGYWVSEPRVEIVLADDEPDAGRGVASASATTLLRWCEGEGLWSWLDPSGRSVFVRQDDAERVVAWLESQGFTKATVEDA